MTTALNSVPPVPPGGATDEKWLAGVRDTVNMAVANPQTTALRPPSPRIGQMVFDTSLNIPIWCKSLNPVVWVRYDGTAV
jgi:hypothetical protein